tara:strand:+ start:699 stop:1001 length:303 start_codon:yes stop_codon:yes gene_type:complete
MSPELDHDAIRKAYPNVTTVDDSVGSMDKDGNLIAVEQSKIDAARIELDKLNYRYDREDDYPLIADQLDLLYKDITAGTVTESGGFATRIKATKDKYPKP